MDSGTVFYIIAIIIYFLYTVFVQKKAENKPEQETPADAPEPQKKASFEDLLREIRKEQAERERDMVLTGESAEKEDLWEKKPLVESPERVKPKSLHQQYQEIKQPLVKLDDQVDINDDIKILGEVEDVAEEQVGVSKYAAMLKNSKKAREAIVLSEIINRKHF